MWGNSWCQHLWVQEHGTFVHRSIIGTFIWDLSWYSTNFWICFMIYKRNSEVLQNKISLSFSFDSSPSFEFRQFQGANLHDNNYKFLCYFFCANIYAWFRFYSYYSPFMFEVKTNNDEYWVESHCSWWHDFLGLSFDEKPLDRNVGEIRTLYRGRKCCMENENMHENVLSVHDINCHKFCLYRF